MDLTATASGLNDLYSQYQSGQAAKNANNQVTGLLNNQQGLLNNQASAYNNQINNLNQNYNDLYNLQSGLTLGNIGNLQNQVSNTSGLQNGALGLLGEQREGLNQFMTGLQGQMGNASQQGQDWLAGGLKALDEQRSGYQQDIDRQLSGMSWLTDMDSPLMQQARQALERKDAAAGRRSQWGDREVQLAGLMMENYGKYAPGLQQGIQASRNAMSNDVGLAGQLYGNFVNTPNQINAGLANTILGGYGQQTRDLQAGANIYDTLGQSNDRANTILSNQIGGMGNLAQILQNQGSLINQAIGGLGSAAQGMGNAAGNANTTGRQAAYSANNQQNQLINSGLGMLGQLFGGSGSSGGLGGLLSSLFGTGNGFSEAQLNADEAIDSDFWNSFHSSGGGYEDSLDDDFWNSFYN